MTVLNIQSLVFLGEGASICQVFIQIIGYYGSKAVGRIVKIFPLFGEEFIGGQELRQVRGQAGLEGRKVRRYEGRLFKLLKGLFFVPLAPLGRGLGRGANQEDKLYSRRMIGCQDIKLLSVLRTKITSLFNLPSCPLNFCSSDNDPLPCPPPREGACGGWSGPLSCSDITSSCKTQVLAGTATLHLCSSDCYPPQPSLIREVARKKLLKHRCQSDILKPLKQVQDDLFNLLKSTYSPIHLFTYSLRKKAAFTLAEGATHVVHFDKIRRAAFTLAEVLITLGIIGVVAAMTMPVLVSNYRKQVVETRLQKFYSTVNQAIKMSEVDNGDKMFWTAADSDDFFNKYLKKYLKYLKYENKRVGTSNDWRLIYLTDGSAFLFDLYGVWDDDGEQTVKTNGGHFIFCPSAKDCENGSERNLYGRKQFVFAFWPNEDDSKFGYHKGRGVEPYMAHWDGDEEKLYTSSKYGCNEESGNSLYCTAVIQHNGWKIPKNYPYRL